MKAIRKLHRYLYLGSVLFFFLLYAPFLYYWARKPKSHYQEFARARRWIGKWSSALVGIRYRIHYETEIDWGRPYIICPNHTSNLDITASVLACPTDFSFIGKQELLNNPVTGLFFRTIDLPLNRESKVSAFRTFKKAQEILAEGRSVLVFPEGTIHPDYPPRLGPFKIGPFRMATEMGIPILPVVIHDAWKPFWDDGKKKGTRPGRIHIEVLRPVEVATHVGQDAANALKDRVSTLLRERWANGPERRPRTPMDL